MGATTEPAILARSLRSAPGGGMVRAAAYDMYDRTYFDREYFELHSGKRRYLEFLAGVVAAETIPSGALLDVGCGLGFFVAAARARGWTAFGMEHALAAAARSERAAAPVVLAAGDAPWPVGAGSLAAVTMWDVIEHFTDYRAALAQASRALAPGGALFVITLNARSWARPLLGRRWAWYRDPTHVQLFSAPLLRRELAAAGFGSIEISTIFNFCSVGESAPALLPLRRIGRVVRWPGGGDSLLAVARRR